MRSASNQLSPDSRQRPADARGRRAAVTGIVAIGLSSLLVNQLIKLIGERSRPDRTQLGVPESRWVLMPARCSGVQPPQSPDGGLASAPAPQDRTDDRSRTERY